jgi:hypothetical protein
VTYLNIPLPAIASQAFLNFLLATIVHIYWSQGQPRSHRYDKTSVIQLKLPHRIAFHPNDRLTEKIFPHTFSSALHPIFDPTDSLDRCISIYNVPPVFPVPSPS